MKKPLAIVCAITADHSFAAGALCRAITRHSPELDGDIIIWAAHDLPQADRTRLLAFPHVIVHDFTPVSCQLQATIQERFSLFCLAKFELFDLLEQYTSVIWLDVDIAIQGDISPLASYGPFSMALEDPAFTDDGTPDLTADFFSLPETLQTYTLHAPHYNSGILVLQDSLPDPQNLKKWCYTQLHTLAPQLKHPDQAIFNLLIQAHPEIFQPLPYEKFNAHPKNHQSLAATIVHAFGAYKLWDDGIVGSLFPEWRRDYLAWVSSGGTPFAGNIENRQFFSVGSFGMLQQLFETLESAEKQLSSMQKELKQEQLKSEKFLLLLQKIQSA